MARDPSPELAAPAEEANSSAASNTAIVLTNTTEMERTRSQSSTPSISSASYTNYRLPMMPFGSSSTPFASSGASGRLPSAALGTASPFAQQHQEEQERKAAATPEIDRQCARDAEVAAAIAAGSIAERKARRATTKPVPVEPKEPVQRPSTSSRRQSQPTASRPAPPAPLKLVPVPIRVPTLHSPAPTGLQSRSPSVNPPSPAVATASSPQAGPGPKTQAKRRKEFSIELPVPKKPKKVEGDSPKQQPGQPKPSAAPTPTPTPPPPPVVAPAPVAAPNLVSQPGPQADAAVRGGLLPRTVETSSLTITPWAAASPTPPQKTRLQNRPCKGFNVMSVACSSCVDGKQDQCSFRHRRTFPVLANHRKSDVDNPIFLPPSAPDDIPRLRLDYCVPFTEDHASTIKTTVAHALVSSIAAEEAHARRAGCVKQRVVLKVHNLCDSCLTTIFVGSWLCRHCGREICLECATALERCHQAPSAKGELEQRERLMKCTVERGIHGGVDLEQAGDHVPLSTARKEDLEKMRRDMEKWKAGHPIPASPKLSQDARDYLYAPDPNAYSSPAETCHPYLRVPVGLLDRNDPPTAPHPAPRPPPTSTTDSVLAELDSKDPWTLFRSLWSLGETMVVDLDLSRHFFEEWAPERFIKMYGEFDCIVASNTGGQDAPSIIREFFKRFLEFDSGGDGESVKLKDFPPNNDFKKLLELFHEFMNALPAGIVTRRDGPLNIAAHSPINSNVPDLGPKGYWSQISNDAPGGQGSTKLHTANILLWSNPMPDGSPGLAAWDIYRAEDSEKIRDFLYELKTKQLRALAAQDDLSVDDVRAVHDDPIHSQEFFLDAELRAELLKEKGVKSWRIWQRPGQVVFIPAGCAHQVCNFSHCIKIAVDFVSIENVRRCWTVTDEFRAQTKGRDLWREDVLQLKNQLLWAWRSCERFDVGQPDGKGNDEEMATE